MFRTQGNMIIPGFGFIPDQDLLNTTIFEATEATGANLTDFQPWYKPVGARMVYMVALGGGGGGGCGQNGASASARPGGGGGGCASISHFLYYAGFLPDVLWVKVGLGGAGGAGGGGGTGTDGQLSFVTYSPFAFGGDVFCLSGFSGTLAGGGINGQSGGAGGQAGLGPHDAPFSGAAMVRYINGTAGTAGGTGTNPGADGGTFQPGGSNSIIMPGTGGGSTSTTNVDHLGGAYNTVFNASWFEQNMPMPAGAGNAGRSGSYFFFGMGGGKYPPVSFGGQGGNSNAAGTAGAGGNGSYGAGGGGGGGGNTAGAGGRGGNGLVLITCWS